MATNIFFQNYSNFNEQNLIDDLVIEAISMFGIDVRYITRTIGEIDPILNEDDTPLFEASYEMEMYVKNVDSFEGEGDFLSKFGLQIRDQMTLVVAMRTFERFVTSVDSCLNRPKEGDLIYLPLNKKIFKVMYVEHESVFYQAGALQVFELRCELFEYANEAFNTGIPYIDNLFDHIDTSQIHDLESLEAMDPISQNLRFEDKKNDILDWSETDPFSEVIEDPTDRKSLGGII